MLAQHTELQDQRWMLTWYLTYNLIKSTDDETGSIKMYLCSPEDIVLNKLEWYKSGNQLSERQWLDVLGVIKVQGDSLDLEYIKRWAKELNVMDLLEKALREGRN
ncbi:MAG: hypothetical protein AB1298_08575 [Bacteroidota bacterium]